MKLLQRFRGNNKEEKVLDGNPYLNARRSMNDHTGAIIASRHIWQAVSLLCLTIAIGAVGGLIYFATQSRFIPYVVEVNKLGQSATIKVADKAAPLEPGVVKATLAAFITDTRSISFDRMAHNNAIWRVYSHLQSSEPATTKITKYMTDPLTSPVKRAAELSVGVEIASVLQQTRDTWEANWTEKVWDRKGVLLEEYRMRGLLTIYVVSPTSATTEAEIWKNPLGIFVRDFTWAKMPE